MTDYSEAAGRARGALESWFSSEAHLIAVTSAYARDQFAVVVGDRAADFALALAYDRMLGRGVWLPSGALGTEQPLWVDVTSELSAIATDLENQAGFMVVCSLSEPSERLSRFVNRIERGARLFDAPDAGTSASEEPTVQARLAELQPSSFRLVMEEHLGSTVLMPMNLEGDGSRSAATGLVAPIPNSLLHPGDLSRLPYWYVDVAIAGDEAPRARDLPSRFLSVSGTSTIPEVTLRASTAGITYNPASLGLITSGTLLQGRLGRPRLRALSMRGWVSGMGSPAGLDVDASPVGRHADLVAGRLGGRAALLDLVGSRALMLLLGFMSRVGSQPNGPGRVKLGPELYLSFEAMRSLLGDDEGLTVDLVDQLIGTRLLRRGLILDCVECSRPSFVALDQLGHEFVCARCDALNWLTSSRWKRGPEPEWYFDLFAGFRELLRQNGEVPLLAASRLRSSARSYSDCAELEFTDTATGEKIAEIDLIAHVDGEVVVVEAKAAGSFGSRAARQAQIRKLLRVAEVVRADRIALATTADHWTPADVAHLQREAQASLGSTLQTSVMHSL